MEWKLILLATLGWTSAVVSGAMHTVQSPDGSIRFAVETEGRLRYSVAYHDKALVENSAMGFAFVGENPMDEGFAIDGAVRTRENQVETWKPVVKNRHEEVRLVYNEAILPLREKARDRRRMDLTVRVFNDGVAFRYTLYGSSRLGERLIADELTEYRVPDTSFAWVGHNQGNGFVGSQETPFKKTPVAAIKADEWCLSPLLVEVDRADYLALMTAHLDDFPGHCFAWRDGALVTRLVPSPTEGPKGVKARFDRRFDTSWRVILVGADPGRFIESEIVQALNPPCAIDDPSWIKPGMSAWDHWWSGDVKMEMPVIKEYIDFAAAQGWPYMLVDWQWYGPFNTPNADITKSAPQINMPELIAYAKERNVKLWLWLYSSDATRNDAYEDAFALYAKWGIAGVKIDFMDRYDREIVNWYRRITASAAKNRLMLDFHGAYAPDGIERTYPNLMTREGVMGEEYSKWSRNITAEHNVTLAFTRMLAGPMDYTPGAFLNMTPEEFNNSAPAKVMNTRAAELAKFVIYESPWTCFCDHPKNVRGQPGAEFVAEVPTVWDDTRFLGGYPGEWIAVARRSGTDWYVGIMNGNEAREVELAADFLPAQGTYRYWTDGARPMDLVCGEGSLPAERRVKLSLAASGGFVARIRPAAATLP